MATRKAALSVLRQGPPVFFAPNSTYKGEGAWVIVRAEDQRKVLQDAITFSSDRGLATEAMGEDPGPWCLLESDPPQHTAFRTLLNPLLSPQRVALMEGGARKRAVDLIEGFRAKGSCEAMQDFASRSRSTYSCNSWDCLIPTGRNSSPGPTSCCTARSRSATRRCGPYAASWKTLQT